MGNFFCLIDRRKSALDKIASFYNRPCRILVLGLDGAGKTTLLYNLKLGEVMTAIPMIGFNTETVQYKHIEFAGWDLGGSTPLRPLWKFYFQCDAVIYVIDAADRSRIDEAVQELHSVLQYEELQTAKLLVLANKQDLPDCMPIHELRAKLNLSGVAKSAHHIQRLSV